ncbi:PRC and DUF2382 domain-containing protein [Streptomyces sp. NBC_00059]|uniref:PRC and DUF2382 domain-containing protein n=1 Tax=Streptomyces sp. NBC_00059 TaxID=2975635 RepID=UPI00224CB390|nr:PRC and DUF2382 domain-containing protein [Streptomyces sp. NBC_00059]MCX5414690.1 PRC and DUF2382 domain-containing protein [Streptomyces sp. NBC_00059]
MGAADGFTDSGELDGLTVYDSDGEKVGTVGRVYVDDDTGKPDWVTVKTGMFGMKESFVPLAGARSVGSDLHVSHTKDRVKEAPRVDADAHLSVSEEEELYRHYGMTRKATGRGDARTTSGTGTGAMGAAGAAGAAGTAGAAGAGTARTTSAGQAKASGTTAGMGTTGSGTGRHRDMDMDTSSTSRPLAGAGAERSAAGTGREEMIRSEEQLQVGTEEYESGRARLHKYVVTENVTRTVPVSHEEVRVVREPLKPGERTTGVKGTSELGEQDVEVTLHAERATVRKEAVPVERVRLETSKVTEQKEVSAELRKEKIDYADGKDMGSGKDTGGEFGQGRRR